MDIEAVVWFEAVARFNSFAAAARFLRQPSSNVSRRIAKLERELGYKLMQRSTRSLTLTEQGRQLLPMAEKLVEVKAQVEDWHQSQQDEPAGLLRVTAPGSFARGPLNDWLIAYRKSFPKVKTAVIHSNDYLDFHQHQLDVAFRQGPLASSNLIAKRLFSIQYGLFASPDWLATQTVIKTPDDILDMPLICLSVKGQTLPWYFQGQTLHPKAPEMLFDASEQCISAAIAGLGLVYLNRYEVNAAIEAGELVEVLPEHKAHPVDFYMVYTEREFLSKKTRSFLQFIEKKVKAFEMAEGLIL
ncbi:LysR family transcriptional regulator [Thaumasiovibrio subtropicus]|uniref:LysR family transcriptional regulator n=1 Tax=Thaumasiovibrio subtropicus TaxID=1891207 RepID=UPI000B3555CB|nr:LysR family transcriptional regulator [Thaumasiovibrio subtropicus]